MARGRPSKKQQILDTAQQLFCELGYQGTTIDLVVQTAGVSKPTVYGHFPSKQVLWQTMLEQAIERSEAQRGALESAGDDWLEPVLAAFAQLASAPEMLAIYRIMLGEQHKMEAAARQLFEDFGRRLESWCERAMPRAVAADRDLRFLVLALCREGILLPALRQEAPMEPARLKHIIRHAVAV